MLFFCYITTANEVVTHFCYIFPSYRNQSIDFHCKPFDWFLYDGNIGPKWVNETISYATRLSDLPFLYAYFLPFRETATSSKKTMIKSMTTEIKFAL